MEKQEIQLRMETRQTFSDAIALKLGGKIPDASIDSLILAELTMSEIAGRFLDKHLPDESTGRTSRENVRLCMKPTGQMVNLSAATADFPYITGDAINKSFLSFYDNMPVNWPKICNSVELKTLSGDRLQLEPLETPTETDEGDANTTGATTESKEDISLGVFRGAYNLTFELFVNDETQLLADRLRSWAGAAVRLEDDQFASVITTNAAMADSVALYHNTHANIATGAALAVGTVATTAQKIREQTTTAGETMRLVPRVLMVPSTLQFTAAGIMDSINLSPDEKIILVTEPRLDATSLTAFYMFADSRQCDPGPVMAFLQGQRQPVIQTKRDFDTDGLLLSFRSVCRAFAADHRGTATNAGA